MAATVLDDIRPVATVAEDYGCIWNTCHAASVNVFLSQEVLAHNHLRFLHTIRGRSGPILMSRGRVLT